MMGQKRQEITCKVTREEGKRIKEGYPLILKDALRQPPSLDEEGAILNITDERGAFLGKGYFGKQNKGYGWILTRNEWQAIDQAFFLEKLNTAFLARKAFFDSTDTTAFRVFNGEGDGIGGLIIDYYDGYFVIQWYSRGIYSFKDEIIEALQNLTEYKAIYEKKRFETKGMYMEDDDFVCGERGQFPIIVKENGVNFAVHLNEGAMVGVFLDQRNVRRKIRDKYAKDKTVLNMFSYTGAFSVFAALGGASKTTSVDLANRSRAKTVEQFSVNGIDADDQEIIVMDVFDYFKYAARKGKSYDMVILDPPSFAKSKKRTFSAAKDYTNLLKEAIAITERGGMIVASTNCSTFEMWKFKKFVKSACNELGVEYQIVEQFSLPPDFKTDKHYKEGNYLKVLFIQLQK